ncbi:MAG TPA: ATP-binding protein [Candidatus Limnocylindria bacterium]|jgi:anti-sigma regulatory factor (Ser/Thr protein kinase)|nr:ATP-binding protein [Candidatus Limnocylindria bacterium]
MDQHLSLRIENTFDAIPAANESATQWLEERDASPAAVYLANLAIEELATNCIKYGYDDSTRHYIEVGITLSETGMTLVISDDGHAFNPLDLPEPDTTLPIEERPIGGLGIHLLRKMSNDMRYERIDGKNRVSIVKLNQLLPA